MRTPHSMSSYTGLACTRVHGVLQVARELGQLHIVHPDDVGILHTLLCRSLVRSVNARAFYGAAELVGSDAEDRGYDHDAMSSDQMSDA
jgi:hypothetical protein